MRKFRRRNKIDLYIRNRCALEGLPQKIAAPYAIILLHAGNAALAVVENGRITHQVISKYVTSKKQGKAQLNYLNTKASRAPGRTGLLPV